MKNEICNIKKLWLSIVLIFGFSFTAVAMTEPEGYINSQELKSNYPWDDFRNNFQQIFPKYYFDSVKVESLSGGFSDDALFKLSFNNKYFVLRFLGDHNDIKKRETISSSYLWASHNNLGPKVYLIDKINYKYFLSQFIQGRTLTLDDTKDAAIIKNLAKILRKTHKAPLPENNAQEFSQFIYGTRWYESHKNKIIGPSVLDEAYKRWKMLDKTIGDYTKTMLHNDPNLRNVLCTNDNQIVLLDWELSGIGDPRKEVAHVLAWYGLDSKLSVEFLSAYFGRKPTSDEINTFDSLKTQILLEFAWVGLSTLSSNLSQQEWDELYEKTPLSIIENLSIIQMENKTKPSEEETRAIFLGLIKHFMLKTKSLVH
jgi:thiamine kinase-like enzyme